MASCGSIAGMEVAWTEPETHPQWCRVPRHWTLRSPPPWSLPQPFSHLASGAGAESSCPTSLIVLKELKRHDLDKVIINIINTAQQKKASHEWIQNFVQIHHNEFQSLEVVGVWLKWHLIWYDKIEREIMHSAVSTCSVLNCLVWFWHSSHPPTRAGARDGNVVLQLTTLLQLKLHCYTACLAEFN